MVIIGFDPGLSHTGYAVLNKEGNNINLVQCGLISPKRNKSLSERLFTIFSETNKLIKDFNPNLVVIENVFYGKNVQSAIKLGQAKSSIMLSSEKYNVDMVDYTPREIKQSIVGNGSASKEQVEFMVKKIFKLDDKMLKRNDISDAIAVKLPPSVETFNDTGRPFIDTGTNLYIEILSGVAVNERLAPETSSL